MPESSPYSRPRFVASIVSTWLGSHLVLIAGHVALVFFYSVAIAPDRSAAEYTAFAQRSGPWFSIVLGGPVFYAVGRFLVNRFGSHGRRAAIAAWTLYSLTDLAVALAIAGIPSPSLAGQWIASQAIKLAAILIATRRGEGGS